MWNFLLSFSLNGHAIAMISLMSPRRLEIHRIVIRLIDFSRFEQSSAGYFSHRRTRFLLTPFSILSRSSSLNRCSLLKFPYAFSDFQPVSFASRADVSREDPASDPQEILSSLIFLAKFPFSFSFSFAPEEVSVMKRGKRVKFNEDIKKRS